MSEQFREDINVVNISAGTGGFTLLQEFKNRFENVTAVVNMADNGGSTGVLRDELGVLPPGDVRQCLVALSEAQDEVRELFSFRFDEGGLKGHTFGNLFLSAFEKMSEGDFSRAVRLAGEVLRIRGAVLPVTTDKVDLELAWPDGETISGEFAIGHVDFAGRSEPHIRLVPETKLNPAAEEAIGNADMVVIAPGNLYGSLAPALVVPGMRETLEQTEADIVYVCNLVTKPGQTDGFKVHNYAREIMRFIGAPVLDYVLYNTERPSEELLCKYMRDGEFLVEACTKAFQNESYQAIGLDMIDDAPVLIQSGDAIAHSRSLIRHNAAAVADQMLALNRQSIEAVS
jgi:uncharacterized cofD-like protein